MVGAAVQRYQFNGTTATRVSTPVPTRPVQQFNHWFKQDIEPLFTYPEQHIATFIWIGVGLLLFILVIAAITALVRYPSETAVMRMVDEYEQTGTKLRFKQGWKLGWNRRAFRMWVIDLVISLPAFIFVALLAGFGNAGLRQHQNGAAAAWRWQGRSPPSAAHSCSFLPSSS